MLRSIETTAKTEDLAIASALEQLGKSREEVSVEILERSKSGFLGIGSTLPKYRVTWETEDPEPAPTPAPAKAPAPAAKPAVTVKPAAKSAPEEEKVRTFLEGLFAHMGVTADIAITPGEENGLNVELINRKYD